MPIAILAILVVVLAVYISSLAADLKAQAKAFDLSKLEQMESASVILDRNGKIFGQIYVENRETVPYDQLPPDLINAVVAVEDAKFYQHHGYDLVRNHPRSAEKFDGWPCAPGRQHHYAATGAQQFFAETKNVPPQVARDFPGTTD